MGAIWLFIAASVPAQEPTVTPPESIVADGVPGFDPSSLDDKRTGSQTFGLVNIRERVSSFGGKFHIDSGPKRGTRITLSLFRGSGS